MKNEEHRAAKTNPAHTAATINPDGEMGRQSDRQDGNPKRENLSTESGETTLSPGRGSSSSELQLEESSNDEILPSLEPKELSTTASQATPNEQDD